MQQQQQQPQSVQLQQQPQQAQQLQISDEQWKVDTNKTNEYRQRVLK